MKVGRGCAALITGASSGIGKALALHLASRGVGLTLVDFDAVEGNRIARQAEEQQQQAAGAYSTSSDDGTVPAGVQFVQCDVTNAGQLGEAFSKHLQLFGCLDICVNNAGIGEKQWFVQDGSTDGGGQWRRVVDVNLTAVIDGTRLAIRAMQQSGSSRESSSGGNRGGVIVNVASAAGLYPSASAPVYSASKGGVVLFTRSLAHLAKTGVRVNALCPEFIETPLVQQMSGQAARHFAAVLKSLGGYIPMSTVVEGAMQLIEDESVAGECMWITNRHGRQWWPTKEEKQRYLVDSVPGTKARQKMDPFSRTSSSRDAGSSRSSSGDGSSGSSREVRTEREGTWSRGPVPAERNTYSHIVVKQLTTNFRSAVAVVQRTLRLPLPPDAVLLYVYYAGINASDVNYSAGRYFGSVEEASRRLPFDAGFEALGVVAAAGEAVLDPSLQPGRPAAALAYGAFGEYVQVEARRVIPVAAPQPEAVALLTSGLTASIALEQAAHMGRGETVLVTAAAGGTGQFAVQLAKLAGNTVVATCGSEEKAALLRTLGADSVIVHSKCDVGKELRLLYPKGVDVVYESVGGAMFQTCLNALALKGRLVVIGMMSQYTAGEGGGWAAKGYPGICEKLLWKSQMLVGFFLLHYMSHMRSHFARLYSLFAEGKLKVAVDPADFSGLASVPDAVDHLQSGRSVGKVIVRIAPEASAIPRGRL